MTNFVAGMKVKMVNCAEAKKYKDKVWETEGNLVDLGHTRVIALKGYPGSFSTKCLQPV